VPAGNQIKAGRPGASPPPSGRLMARGKAKAFVGKMQVRMQAGNHPRTDTPPPLPEPHQEKADLRQDPRPCCSSRRPTPQQAQAVKTAALKAASRTQGPAGNTAPRSVQRRQQRERHDPCAPGRRQGQPNRQRPVLGLGKGLEPRSPTVMRKVSKPKGPLPANGEGPAPKLAAPDGMGRANRVRSLDSQIPIAAAISPPRWAS